MTDRITIRFESIDGTSSSKTYQKEASALAGILAACGEGFDVDATGNAIAVDGILTAHIHKGPAGLTMEKLCNGVAVAGEVEAADPQAQPRDDTPAEDPEPEVIGDDAMGYVVAVVHNGLDLTTGKFPTKESAQSFVDRLISHPRQASRKRPKTPRENGELTEKFCSTTVTLHGTDTEEKLTKQARSILACIASLVEDDEPTTQGAIVAKLPEFVQTVQEPKRIYDFYRKALIDTGCISVS